MRRANAGLWWPQAAWLGWVPAMLAAIVPDLLRVWRFGCSAGRRGEVGQKRLDLPAEPAAVAAARRGLAVLVIGATPATVVIDSFADPNTVVLHRVGASASRLDAQVTR